MSSGTDVIINLTTGMGGDLIVDDAHPSAAAPGSDMVPALERLEHIEALLPEMCTLDCGSMNFSDGDYVAVVTANQLRTMARASRSSASSRSSRSSTRDTSASPTSSSRRGSSTARHCSSSVSASPRARRPTRAPWRRWSTCCRRGAWAAFAISRMEMPIVAQSVLLGGNVRVGLEDNLYLRRGVFASNAQLVERAVASSKCSARALTASEARRTFGLRQPKD